METIYRLKRSFHNLILAIKNGNLFQTGSTDPVVIHQQILTTHLFLILFSIAFIILFSYTLISEQTITETIQQPNFATFKRLEKEYSSTLYCPCTRISVPHGLFVETKPLLHQICFSDFVNQTWIDFIFGANLEMIWPMDVRTSLSAMWQMIATLCRSARNTIDDAMKEFANDPLISSFVFSERYLNASIQAALEDARQKAINDFTTDLNIIQTVTHINGFMSGIATNSIGFVITATAQLPFDAYISELNYKLPGTHDSCHCHRSRTCQTAAGLYLYTNINKNMIIDLNQIVPNLTFPGIMFDCLPSQMTFASSLECFYNLSCVNTLLSVYPETINISILNNIPTSRFPPTMLLEQIINQLFLEAILNDTYFSDYYKECAPISCSYAFSQRYNLIFVVTILAGLVGGLNTMLRVISIILINGTMLLKRKLLRRNIEVQSNSNIRIQLEQREILIKIKTVLIQLNIFNDYRRQAQSDIKEGRVGTRLYVLLLIVTVIVLISYTTQSVQIFTITVKSPTLELYEVLEEHHRNSLQCSCTTIGIPYKDFIEIIPTYHQICSSDFIKPSWYESLLAIMAYHDGADFVGISSSYFKALAVFCQLANDIYISAYKSFLSAKFVNSQVLSRLTFAVKTNVSLETFLKTTRAEFLYTILLVTDILRVDKYANLLVTNTKFQVPYTNRLTTPKPYLVYSAFVKYNSSSGSMCSCGKNINCTNKYTYYSGLPMPLGISVRCQIIDTTLQSSFACWYNDECFKQFHDYMILFNDQVPTNMAILDPNQPSRFSPNMSFETIVNEMMVEYFNSFVSYEFYYHNCQPESCTYTYETRNNYIYIATTIIGLLGGINVILRLLCPLIAKLILKIRKSNGRNAPLTMITQQNFSNRTRDYCFQFPNEMAKFNLFSSGSTQSNVVRYELFSTRLYLLLLFTSFIVIIMYTITPATTVTNRIEKPSLMQYENLINNYNSTLHCPCSQISILYEKFVNSTHTYHQVCSSDFVKDSWILFLSIDNYSSVLSRSDFRTASGASFQLLSTLCQLAQTIMQKTLEEFMGETFSNAEAISEYQFLSQMDSITSQLQSHIELRFSHILQLIRDFISGNAYVSSYALNWYFWINEIRDNEVMLNAPVIINNQCSCGTRNDCVDPEPFASLMPGWVLGCSVLETVLRSTLEVFYNQTSIDYLENYLTMSNPINYPERVYANAMNATLTSRFPSNTTIQNIVDKLFIEELSLNLSFSSFFEQCAPLYCLYAVDQRKTAGFVISRILGLYGGLTVTLRFIVPYITQLLLKLKSYLCNNQVTPLQ